MPEFFIYLKVSSAPKHVHFIVPGAQYFCEAMNYMLEKEMKRENVSAFNHCRFGMLHYMLLKFNRE